MKVMLDKGAYAPEYAYDNDGGMDLRTPIAFDMYGEDTKVIDTGVHVAIPKGCVGFLKSKSGMNVNKNMLTEGVIDSGYTGSIKVKVYKHYTDGSDYPYHYHFEPGDKITQLVIIPIEHVSIEIVDSLDETARGENGFGSSGR